MLPKLNFGKMLCQERIEIPKSNERVCTYCMRPLGHTGKHSPEPLEEDKNAETNKQ